MSPLEAYDLIRFAETFAPRLAAAEERLATERGLAAEKAWLGAAVGLVREALGPAPTLLERVRDLPELAEVREDFASELQNGWVDALEKLHAGITFAASSRSPVIDALFPNVKFPQLRRASREAVEEWAAEYERRARTGYVTRMLGHADFELIKPVLAQVTDALAAWRAMFSPSTLSAEQAVPLRGALSAVGDRLDLAVRQARLLAEAALAPLAGEFDALGLAAKPRRRAGRGPEAEPLPEVLEAEEALDAVVGAEPSPAPEDAAEAVVAEPAAQPAAPAEPAPQEGAPEPETPAPKPARARGARKKATPPPAPSEDPEG